MVSIRVFFSLIVVLLVLNKSYSVEAQSGTFVNYEDEDSSLGRSLKRMSTAIRMGMSDAMSSNKSPIYDMVRNGTTLGINVLSGLVKVDRVREPGQPRGLMVRVFGIPVYNRGLDNRFPLASDIGSRRTPEARPVGGGDIGRGGEEEDELPLDPLVR